MARWSFDESQFVNVPNTRERVWVVELWPDDPSHAHAIDSFDQYNIVGILHDRDVKDDGSLAKPHHYRVYIFRHNKWRYALADELGITPNYIQEVQVSKKAACLYSIHYNDPDKFQYSLDDLYAGRGIVQSYISDNRTEPDKVLSIIGYIDSQDCFVYYRPLTLWCVENGCYDALRRGGRVIEKIVKEHNLMYMHVDSNGNLQSPF